jgi:spermidine synthase
VTTTSTERSDRNERVRNTIAIAVVSLAGLLLEVAYTRVISYKLWYYYTYLVIGLALLGIGSGGIAVSVIPAVKRASTRWIIASCSIIGSATTIAGFWFIAVRELDTTAIWQHETSSQTRTALKSLAELGAVCFAIFATFVALGIVLSTLLGRARDDIGRLYFADLAAAGVACVVAIPFISAYGPPRVIMLGAACFAAVGLASLVWRQRTIRLVVLGAAGVLALVVSSAGFLQPDLLPDIVPDARKIAYDADCPDDQSEAECPRGASDWGPVFRVDAQPVPQTREGWQPPGGNAWLLIHDGTYGAGMHRWNGDAAGLTYFDTDPRRIPFEVLGEAPDRTLIIGSAGGNEILASLHFGAKAIEAVELNPVTVRLLEDDFNTETGDLPGRPEVDLHQGDGRTYLARSDGDYDLIWFVAPDSYAANNAASSGAFVLSESYLYTSEMIQESLEHLSDDGVIVVQFGELLFSNDERPEDARPNRTSRYLVTARHALRALGIERPENHLLVAVEQSQGAQPAIVVKRTPFTESEIAQFTATVPTLKDTRLVYAPGAFTDESIPARIAGAPDEKTVDAIVAAYPGEVGVITDDAPFFWHFEDFGDVLGEITESWNGLDPEDTIGERVLLLLLGFAVLYAAVFLFVPFVFVRRQWRRLPAKASSALYFACLGLGFMFYEITMIQRLVQFLGYPTRSLTVTLAAILISTGVGALASKRFSAAPGRALAVLLGLLAALTLFYRLALDNLTDSLLDQSVLVRIVVSVLVLIPLGLCLGMFMPLGLGVVSDMGDDGESYTAWAWAVNGFFSVIGSVLTTILAMELGFSKVQVLAWIVYAVAVVAFIRLHRRALALPQG